MNIAVLASGNGSNFQAIARYIKENNIGAEIKLLISDVESAYVRKRARDYSVPDVFINPKEYENREGFNNKILNVLKENDIDLVLLAGFMRVLCPFFVAEYKNRMLNIHPALLPSFKGENAIKDAYDYGVKVTGVTVHFVDEKVDHGPIVLQEAVFVDKEDDLESLENKIHKTEHRLYPEAVRLLVEGKLEVKGRKVFVTD